MSARASAHTGNLPWTNPNAPTKGTEYLSSGWHSTKNAEWWTDKIKQGKLHQRTSSDGTVRYFFADDFVDDSQIYFHPGIPDERYLDYAITSLANRAENNVRHEEGCGHIVELWYSYTHFVFKVKFESGDVCVFFGVPHEIATELLNFARDKTPAEGRVYKTGAKKGQQVHLLGVRFWDLIRIRGSHTGARFKFEYQTRTSSLSKQRFGNRRYFVKLTPENASILYGNKRPDLHYGQYVSTILNEDQIKQLAEAGSDAFEHNNAALAIAQGADKDNADKMIEKISDASNVYATDPESFEKKVDHKYKPIDLGILSKDEIAAGKAVDEYLEKTWRPKINAERQAEMKDNVERSINTAPAMLQYQKLLASGEFDKFTDAEKAKLYENAKRMAMEELGYKRDTGDFNPRNIQGAAILRKAFNSEEEFNNYMRYKRVYKRPIQTAQRSNALVLNVEQLRELGKRLPVWAQYEFNNRMKHGWYEQALTYAQHLHEQDPLNKSEPYVDPKAIFGVIKEN